MADDRQQRGLMIAALFKIEKRQDGKWLVPSQSGNGTVYEVDTTATPKPTCTCPDHQDRKIKCKHMYAIEFTSHRETTTDADGETTTTLTQRISVVQKVTYKQDWNAYDRAQTTEKEHFLVLLHDLCGRIAEPVHEGAGRPPLSRADMVFAGVYKVFSTYSARRFMTDLRDAKAKGLIDRVPHYNSIQRYLYSPELTPILKWLVIEAAKPLAAIESDFAPDSSGFATSRFIRWFDIKYGKTMEKQEWVKVHIMTGVRTNVVTAIEILDKHTGDAPQLPSLLQTTRENFNVRELSADAGYLSNDNLRAVFEAGAVPFIAFKENTTGGIGGVFEKCFHFYNLYRDKFLEHYHKRSNVESTFSMVKAKFRDHIRAKSDTGMVNEVLCKFVCHNLCCLIQSMCELRIEPEFWTEPARAIQDAVKAGDEAEGKGEAEPEAMDDLTAWEFV